MSHPTHSDQSPEMQVAARIVATLVARNLIAPEQRDALRGQIATGALTTDDWILVARRAIAIDSRALDSGAFDPQEGLRDD